MYINHLGKAYYIISKGINDTSELLYVLETWKPVGASLAGGISMEPDFDLLLFFRRLGNMTLE